jgi:hypothetical protein
VWFDQSELRGGDAWDQSIRKQIKNCALFMPIISAHTQTRLEGYFRLEWKLAEDRSHLMAKGTAFVVPVTVDGTSDHDAQVPDAFLAVQWTRLPGGEAPPGVCRPGQEASWQPLGRGPTPGHGGECPGRASSGQEITSVGWRGRCPRAVRMQQSSSLHWRPSRLNKGCETIQIARSSSCPKPQSTDTFTDSGPSGLRISLLTN